MTTTSIILIVSIYLVIGIIVGGIFRNILLNRWSFSYRKRAAFIGFFWIITLPVFFFIWLCEKVGDLISWFLDLLDP